MADQERKSDRAPGTLAAAREREATLALQADIEGMQHRGDPEHEAALDALEPGEPSRLAGQQERARQREAVLAQAAAAPGPDLEELTRDELYDAAKEADIPGRSDMSKAELVDAVEDNPEAVDAAVAELEKPAPKRRKR